MINKLRKIIGWNRKTEYQEIGEEIDKLLDLYRGSDLVEAKRCYDQYIGLIIEGSDLIRDLKNDLYSRWDGGKK